MMDTCRNHIGVCLATLAVLGCTQMAPAADKSKARIPMGTRVLTEPAIVGSGQPPLMRKTRGFVGNIDALARMNREFRKVLYTAQHAQLVIMALKPGEDIGAEVHPNVDQFLRVEEGSGEAIMGNTHTQIQAGYAVLVPAGTKHNIVNTGKTSMKLYTLYAPPQHRDGVVQHTRTEAQQAHEHFDGATTR